MTDKAGNGAFTVCFTVVMLLCAAILAWASWTECGLLAQKADLELSLQTSRGRERRQEAEYAQVCEELPAARAALA